jgi:hypothetical protein
MNLRLCAALAIWIGLGLPARAHDFWIVPSGFRPATGERVSVQLEVGQRFESDAVPRNPEKIEAFFAVDARGSRIPVEGIDGSSPAGFLRARTAGLAWIGYRSRTTAIEQNGARFEAYSARKARRIALARERAGTNGLPGKEIYSRCAKALIRVGDDSGRTVRSDPRLPLEIVAEAGRRQRARTSPVRVLCEVALSKARSSAACRRRIRRRDPRPDGRGGSRAVRARPRAAPASCASCTWSRLRATRAPTGRASGRRSSSSGPSPPTSLPRASRRSRRRLRQPEADAQVLDEVDLDVAREDARRTPAARSRARASASWSAPDRSRIALEREGFAGRPAHPRAEDRPRRRDLRARHRSCSRAASWTSKSPPVSSLRARSPGSRGRRNRGRSARRARR